MTLQALILLGLKLSIIASVFALGLDTTAREVTHLLRHPEKLGRSLVAIDLIMPAFAILAIAATSLPGPVKIALGALSVSPIPPVLPQKAMKMGGTEDYVVSLLVIAAIIALVFVPLAVNVMGAIFGIPMHIPFVTIAKLMALTILVPLGAGFLFRNLWPDAALRLAKPVGAVAGVLLLACALPVIVKMWPQMLLLAHDGTLAVFAAFVVVGLAAGHVLGGPEPSDRTVLAIATASRHPGVAIAIATAAFPEEKLATAAVILFLVVSAIVAFPYVYWRKHSAAPTPPVPLATH